jgi:hypothetical protein
MPRAGFETTIPVFEWPLGLAKNLEVGEIRKAHSLLCTLTECSIFTLTELLLIEIIYLLQQKCTR